MYCHCAGGRLTLRKDNYLFTRWTCLGKSKSFGKTTLTEDVPAGFRPATGTISHLKFPNDARIDSAVGEGDNISPFYDPMIAKLTTHGATRQGALSRLQRALADTELAGATTNVGFLHALASQREFVNAQVHTGLIAEHLDELIQIPPTTSQQIAAAALAAIAPDSAHPVTGFSLWTPLRRHVTLNGPDGQVCAEVHFIGHNQTRIVLGDEQHTASWSDGQIQIDGGLIRYHRQARNIWLFGPNDVAFQLDDPLERRQDTNDDSDEVRAPMPGSVQSLSVQPGDSVAEGDVLLVLEAMKMEHGLRAPRDGHIKDVMVAPGDQIAHGALLIRLATGDEA